MGAQNQFDMIDYGLRPVTPPFVAKATFIAKANPTPASKF